jgi:hypothetical protein
MKMRRRWRKAAEIKATHGYPFADAWIAAAATLLPATLIHKDPELDALAISQERLPSKRMPPSGQGAAD